MSNLPEGWVETTLGEISFSKQYGYTESASTEKVGPKFLRITDIQDDFIDWNAVPYCPISEKDKLKYQLGVGDIVIARTGNSTGETATIKDDSVDAVFASYLIRFKINPQIADYNFIDFSLRSKRWKMFVKSIKGGSAQGGANANNFAEYPINLPPLPEQKAIADMLASFDEKIELLREQNKTLETLAQTIFKEWFVHFNFPDQHGKPYRSNGGEMVESELGLIPKGWRVGKIKDFVNILSGFAFKSKDFVEDGRYGLVTIRNVQDGSFVKDTKDRLNTLPAKMPAYCHLRTGDILLSLTGNVGRVCHVIGKAYLLNQRVAKLQAKEKTAFGFVYLFFRQSSVLNEMENISSGTAQQNLSPIKTAELDAIIPNLGVLNEFSSIVNPMIEKILSNEEEIQTLSKTRDTLLPKLMSGQVRVNI